MEKAYRLPDPRTDPASFLVHLYKTMKAVEFDDREWNKIYFARAMKRAQQLLEIVADVQAAARCMTDLKDRFEGDNLSWTLETILQYSFEWKAEHQKKTDRECLQRFLGEYTRGVGGLQRLDAGALLEKLKKLPEPPKSENGTLVPAKSEEL